MKSLEEMIAAAQNAAQTIQTQMEQAQTVLDTIEVEGAAGGGLVKIRATAKGRILGVSIDDSLMDLSEKQMLEDLLAAAFNDAREKADAASNEEMGKMTSGLPLPPSERMCSSSSSGCSPTWPSAPRRAGSSAPPSLGPGPRPS